MFMSDYQNKNNKHHIVGFFYQLTKLQTLLKQIFIYSEIQTL